VAGYAKWFVPVGDEKLKIKERFAEWHEQQDKGLCEKFFWGIGKERVKLMGDEQYYCEFSLPS
jgi:hypothetical protein